MNNILQKVCFGFINKRIRILVFNMKTNLQFHTMLFKGFALYFHLTLGSSAWLTYSTKAKWEIFRKPGIAVKKIFFGIYRVDGTSICIIYTRIAAKQWRKSSWRFTN